MKRGQVTLFIIVGIVVLMVLGFSIMLMRTLQPQAIVQVTEDDYAQFCLEQVSEQTILHVLASGGTGEMHGGARLAIATDAVINTTRYLQWKEFSGPGINYPLQYGLYAYQPLCLAQGPNRPNASLDNSNSCMPGTYQLFENDNQVIQYTLARAIEEGLQKAECPDQSAVQVIFGGEDVTVRTENHTARIPIRMKRMYNVAARVIDQELKDLEHNMNEITTLPGCTELEFGNNCLVPGMSVHIERQNDFTIVIVNDTKTLIHGAPVLMRVAIENRYPVTKQTLNPEVFDIMWVHTNGSAQFGTPTTKVIQTRDPDDTLLQPNRCQIYLDPEPPAEAITDYRDWMSCVVLNEGGMTNYSIVKFEPQCHTPRKAENVTAGPFIVEVCDTGGLCNNFTGTIGSINADACDKETACNRWSGCTEPAACPAETADETPAQTTAREACEDQYPDLLDAYTVCAQNCRAAYGDYSW